MRQKTSPHDMQTVQVSILRDIIYNSVKRGVDFSDACKAVDLTPGQLNDAESLVHWEKAGLCWTYCVEKTKDLQLGLRIGQQPGMAFLGTLTHLANDCKTIEEAFRMIMRYNAVVSTVFKYDLHESAEGVSLLFEPAPIYQLKYPEAARQAVELSMSSVLTMINLLSLRDVYPLRIELNFPKRNVREYEEILRSTVTFNAPVNSLQLSRADFELPIVRHDQSLFHLFHHVLEERVKVTKQVESMSNQIRKAIASLFKGQAPPIEVMADQFHLTTRTLQRRLATENTTYRELVSAMNSEIVSDLHSLHVSKEKIASLLGYSDASAIRKRQKQSLLSVAE